jgi:hypothetical protein
MIKPNQSKQAIVFCGIDVSAATLAVAVQQEDRQSPVQIRSSRLWV